MKNEELLVAVVTVLLALLFLLSPGEKQISVGLELVAPVVQAVPVIPVYRNVPPVAAFVVPSNCGAPCMVLFDASGSHDPDGYIVSYEWDFGYGTRRQSTSRNWVRYPFTRNGGYRVILTVVDNLGARASHIEWVIIMNQWPIARFTDREVQRFSNGFSLIELDASCSIDDGNIVGYWWTIDNRSLTVYSSYGQSMPPWKMQVPLQRGKSYFIRLTVRDDKGAEGTNQRRIYVP